MFAHGKMSMPKKLEMFDGTGDIQRFIDRFEFAKDVDEVKDVKTANDLVLHLNDIAYDVCKAMKDSNKQDMTKMKKSVACHIQHEEVWVKS